MEKIMEPVCGLDVALHYIGGKWKPLLLFYVQYSPRRFGEFKRLVEGISEKVLIQQLKAMTEDGIITRHDFREVPPRVEYSITDFGRSLAQALQPLCEWGTRNRENMADRMATAALTEER
ncbi:winged helix-turn-helix transcriptional regulator [Enterobacter sp. PGRG2]|uniref:winged helix-turn-helix transcriptional regulator n=1 Tax=Enterobacter sp. PGRG2 TaxID=3104013 RepID=UPI002ABE0198|nr:helix-turn-helix domain-containing protein [Enterobacter sp. PGRG2]WJD48469.1 helix-turn-helix domain-containing protein [Enterobacter sp. PGRG2]